MVKLTPEGRAWKVSSEQADDERSMRVYSGMALVTPQHWERNHCILTMTTLDTFEVADTRRGDSPVDGYARRNPRGEKAKHDGDDHLSQHEVWRVHAGGHDMRDGVYNKRDRQRNRRFHDARLHAHVQSDIQAHKYKLT